MQRLQSGEATQLRRHFPEKPVIAQFQSGDAVVPVNGYAVPFADGCGSQPAFAILPVETAGGVEQGNQRLPVRRRRAVAGQSRILGDFLALRVGESRCFVLFIQFVELADRLAKGFLKGALPSVSCSDKGIVIHYFGQPGNIDQHFGRDGAGGITEITASPLIELFLGFLLLQRGHSQCGSLVPLQCAVMLNVQFRSSLVLKVCG